MLGVSNASKMAGVGYARGSYAKRSNVAENAASLLCKSAEVHNKCARKYAAFTGQPATLVNLEECDVWPL